MIKLVVPESANCPVLVKATAFLVTLAMPDTGVPVGAVITPVAVSIVLPVGTVALSIAMSRVGVAVVSTLAITCEGKKLGRRATWSTKELAQLVSVGFVAAILTGAGFIGAPAASKLLSAWLFIPSGLLA